jgi:hypothetical protein
MSKSSDSKNLRQIKSHDDAPGPSKFKSRKSRMSIASGLSTPFDIDDIELLAQCSDEELTESTTDIPHAENDEEDSSVSESDQNERSATEPVQINLYQLVLEMAREDKIFFAIFLIVILILVLLLQLVSVFLYCTLFDSHFCKVIFN